MESPRRQSNRSRFFRLLFIWGATCALGWRTFGELAHLSLTDERYSYIAAIPVICACLLIGKRKLFFTQMEYSLGWGLPLLILGLGMHWYAGLSIAFSVLGIVMAWIAGFILCFGSSCAKRAIFPLLFLVLMVPMPGFVMDGAISALQTGSAVTSEALFRLLGVPVVRDGMRFSLPGIDIEIAKQCSGIRSSLSLFITGILASYLLLQTSGKRVFFSLLTIPVAIFKNGVRIVALSWLAVYVNPGFLEGKLHQYGGLPVSLMALGILGPIVFALRRSEGLPWHQKTTTLESVAG